MKDAAELYELGQAEKDETTLKDIESSVPELEAQVGKLELARMLSGENDRNNCYMEINAGAGGTDAMDWAQMLVRIYTR